MVLILLPAGPAIMSYYIIIIGDIPSYRLLDRYMNPITGIIKVAGLSPSGTLVTGFLSYFILWNTMSQPNESIED